MKDAFNGLISRMSTAEERISELADMTAIETFKTEKQKYKNWKNGTEYPKTVGQIQKKCIICITGIEGE